MPKEDFKRVSSLTRFSVLMGKFTSGLVSLWLAPIVFSLVLAVPLSALSGLNIASRAPQGLRMDSPHTLRVPGIVAKADAARADFKVMLDRSGKIAAE